MPVILARAHAYNFVIRVEKLAHRRTVSRLYAGEFYDDLYDYYSDMNSVNSVCRELIDLTDAEDARLPFLSICSAYDAIYRSLPAPIWWMAGNLEVAAQFAAGFLRRLSEFTEGSGVML